MVQFCVMGCKLESTGRCTNKDHWFKLVSNGEMIFTSMVNWFQLETTVLFSSYSSRANGIQLVYTGACEVYQLVNGFQLVPVESS